MIGNYAKTNFHQLSDTTKIWGLGDYLNVLECLSNVICVRRVKGANLSDIKLWQQTNQSIAVSLRQQHTDVEDPVARVLSY